MSQVGAFVERVGTSGNADRSNDPMTDIEKEFSQQTIAFMEIALERACRFLPEKLNEEKTRRAIAGVIINCAREKTQTLAGMTEAARQAVAVLIAEEASGESERPQDETFKSPPI